MPPRKSDHMAEDIKREISAIIRDLKDPRVRESFFTIVRVDFAHDLSLGRIYVSAMEGLESAKRAVEGLESASGYIRRELGLRLKLRKAPELKFIADDSVRSGIELFKKLNEDKKGEE